MTSADQNAASRTAATALAPPQIASGISQDASRAPQVSNGMREITMKFKKFKLFISERANNVTHIEDNAWWTMVATRQIMLASRQIMEVLYRVQEAPRLIQRATEHHRRTLWQEID